MHLRDVRQGRADEGSGADGPLPFGGYRGLGADAPDQRVSGGHQWPVQARQAPCPQLRMHRYDQNRHFLTR